MQRHVLGLVDNAHSTAAQPLDDAVVRDGLADHLQECYGARTGMSINELLPSFAYSALASFRLGVSECGSAFFQSDDSIEGADSVPNPETQNFVGCNRAKAYECSQKFSIIHMLALKVH